MKSIYAACIIVLALIIVLASCETQPQKEERLARQYCSSCHLFPDPAMLDKETWDKSVMPAMAFRMGMDHSKLETLNPDDIATVLKSLPSKPMVTNEEWESIRNYFVTHAPDTIRIPEPEQEDALTQFTVTKFR